MTALYVCCKHDYQNKKYDGRTVHNLTKSGSYRCTVCNKIYNSTPTKKVKTK